MTSAFSIKIRNNSYFVSFQELSEIHAGFHSQLRKAVTPGSLIRLSEVFLNWREKFLIYGEYCANLPVAQALIQDVCNRSQLVNQEVIVSMSVCEVMSIHPE